MTMSILEQYDKDGHIPVLGFGAKLPPFFNVGSACFSMNGNIFEPDCYRTKGILKTYYDKLPDISMHGPAAHAPCIKHFVDLISQKDPTQDDQFYNILVIITRGAISDGDKVLEQVVRATNHAMSIIIVAVGKENAGKFETLEFLDGEADEEGNIKIIDKHGNRAKRDIV